MRNNARLTALVQLKTNESEVSQMAQNFNYYAIIGNNGYGLSSDWSEITSQAKFLQNEWHKGFQTDEEAYDWLVEQARLRRRLNSNGICDLATLRSQKLVVIDSVQHPEQTSYRKSASIEEVSSLEELDQAIDQMIKKKFPKKAVTKKDSKKELLKRFECWLDTLEGEQE